MGDLGVTRLLIDRKAMRKYRTVLLPEYGEASTCRELALSRAVDVSRDRPERIFDNRVSSAL